jgi:hypothetical protein
MGTDFLLQTYLAQVADWIIQRAQAVPPTLGMAGKAKSTLWGLLCVFLSYVLLSAATSSSSAMAVEAPAQSVQPVFPRHFPAPLYASYADVGNMDKIFQKVEEFNSKVTSSQLTGERRPPCIATCHVLLLYRR